MLQAPLLHYPSPSWPRFNAACRVSDGARETLHGEIGFVSENLATEVCFLVACQTRWHGLVPLKIRQLLIIHSVAKLLNFKLAPQCLAPLGFRLFAIAHQCFERLTQCRRSIGVGRWPDLLYLGHRYT